MKLTESQINTREELFYELIEFIVNEAYEFDEDYEITDEDAAVTEGVMQYFVENYKEPSLQENINEAMTGCNINEELYIDIMEAIILDESLGGFIAGAVHGAGNFLANQKAAHALKATNKTGAKSMKTGRLKKKLDKSPETGILHNMKKNMIAARAETQNKKASEANMKSRETYAAAQDKTAKRQGLADKIDKKIADTKQNMKNKGVNFLNKVARFAGHVTA